MKYKIIIEDRIGKNNQNRKVWLLKRYFGIYIYINLFFTEKEAIYYITNKLEKEYIKRQEINVEIKE